MTALLAIADAARATPDAPAIITADGAITFAALAARVERAERPAAAPGHAAAIVADADVATIVQIVAALARRQPLALIAARATAAEQAAQRARVAATPVPADAAFVVFTSGSTGRPKGVVLSRAAAAGAADASAAHLGWRPDDRWLLALPLAHVGGLAIVVRCLRARRPIVLAAPRDLGRHRATLASLVPAQLTALLDDPAWRSPPSLRAVLLGGAATAPALVARARARGVPVLTTYGMTETFGQVATGDAATPVDAIGAPLPGVTVVGGTVAAPAPLIVRSPGLMTGYLDEPAPALGDGFVTRDLGHVADGLVRVVGRVDDVIITGGENVHPATIEAALVALPGVAAAVVVGVADARWGEVIAAAIAPGPGFDPAIVDAAIATWPAHHRPRRLALLAELPRTASDKIDRQAVARYLRDRGAQLGSSARTPNAAR
ncbi:MAG: AMP-binding protein [Myxococcales bacterium]|nr:AMP-binding protein [Myxococcales bacterium]